MRSNCSSRPRCITYLLYVLDKGMWIDRKWCTSMTCIDLRNGIDWHKGLSNIVVDKGIFIISVDSSASPPRCRQLTHHPPLASLLSAMWYDFLSLLGVLLKTSILVGHGRESWTYTGFRVRSCTFFFKFELRLVLKMRCVAIAVAGHVSSHIFCIYWIMGCGLTESDAHQNNISIYHMLSKELPGALWESTFWETLGGFVRLCETLRGDWEW